MFIDSTFDCFWWLTNDKMKTALFCVHQVIMVQLLALHVIASPVKRGLVGGSCDESILFDSLARHWSYNYAVRSALGKGEMWCMRGTHFFVFLFLFLFCFVFASSRIIRLQMHGSTLVHTSNYLAPMW